MGYGKRGGGKESAKNPGNKAYARIMGSKQVVGSDSKGAMTFKRDFAKEGNNAPPDWGACGSSAK